MKEYPNNIRKAIPLFFRPPIEYEELEYYGTLYLLRRDILTCLGTNPNTGKPFEHGCKATWSAIMGILAGIDLLGKFMKGEGADVGLSKTKFMAYLERYFELDSEEDREILYQLRCSVLHSFGWYSVVKATKREYRFQLSGLKNALLIEKTSDAKNRDVYVIGLQALYEQFEESICAYSHDLVANETLLANFDKIFPDYGWMRIGPPQ